MTIKKQNKKQKTNKK